MRPQPASIMSGTASCTQVKVPVRFTAIKRSHFSGVISTTGSKASMPALVTTMVIGPRSWRTEAYTRSIAPRSATSTSYPDAV